MKDLRGVRITIGTDCSGIEAPIQALKKFKIPYTHEFSSDIDKHAIKSIKANYKPRRLYGDSEGKYPDGDIRNRDNSTLPKIDLYVAGFPCQGNSNMGKRKGIEDCRGKSVFDSCVDTIKHTQPELFILENVPGIKTVNKGKYWEYILKTLNDIVGYTIGHMVLNSKDYGIPQNRRRIFIVGKRGVGSIIEPPYRKSKNIDSMLIKNHLKYPNVSERIYNSVVKHGILNKDIITDVSYIQHRYNKMKIAPCLLTHHNMWYIKEMRPLSAREYLNLQGFPKNFKQVVSETQMKKQAGNSMTVDTIGCVIRANLYP